MGCNRYSLIRNLLADGLRFCSVVLVISLFSLLSSRVVKADSIGLSVDTVNISVTSGRLGAGSQRLNVVYNTDAFNGYNVTMSIKGDSNSLTHSGQNGAIPSLVGATESAPKPLTPNSWGYAISGRGKFDSGYTSANVSEKSVWASLPSAGSSVIINEGGRATGTSGVDFDVWFGVRGTDANDIMTAGEYTARVVYTAVANPVELPELVDVTPKTYNLGDVTVPARVTITGSKLAALAADGGHVCITPNSNAISCEDATAIPATIVGRPSYSQVVVDLPNSKDKVTEGQKYTILVGVPDGNGGHFYGSLPSIFEYTATSEIAGISPSSYDLGGDLPIEMVGGAGDDTSNSGGLHTQTHQVILTESGQVFTWGANNNGQLGTGDNDDRDTPFNITDRFNSGGDKIVQVSTKGDFNIALTQSGQVYTWGNNYCGQLGNGDTGPCVGDKGHATPDVSKYVNVPINITSQFGLPAGRQIVFVKAGWRQAFAIDSENNLYAWGANYYSQLGLGITDKSVSKPAIVNFDSIGGIDGQIIDLATDSHTLVLTDTGHVYAWGYNYNGQLGNGDSGSTADSNRPIDITDRFNGEKIIQVEASSNGSIVLTDGGEIYAWGENTYGNLGFGEALQEYDPWIGSSYMYLLSSDARHPTTPTKVTMPGHISQLAAGFSKTLAITDNGQVYAWGNNSDGQLGIAGDSGDAYRMCNRTNWLGAPTECNDQSTKRAPILLAGYDGMFASVSAAGDSLFAIGANGHVYSWGLGGTPRQGDVTDSVNHELMVVRGANLNPNNNTASRVFIDFIQVNGQFDEGEQCRSMTTNTDGSRITCNIPVGDGSVSIPEGDFDVYVELSDGAKLKSPVKFRYYR